MLDPIETSGGVTGDAPARADASALLPAKLARPEPVERWLRRERLIDALWSLTDRPVTVVTGPAGSGKSQLIAAWADDSPGWDTIAWLTLDQDDRRQPARMWRHLLAALRRAGALLPAALLDWTDGPDHRAVIEVAAVLARHHDPIVLVLDDVGWLDAEQLHEVEFLLRHAQGRLRLVLIGRHRPQFPLHRYRLTDQLSEVPAADLALHPAEVRAMFALYGIDLTDAALDEVTRQTRGWLAGVRLCAMAMRDEDGVTVPALAGHDYIVDYFAGEILDRLTPPQRRLLAGVGRLDAFTAELAALVGGPHGTGATWDVLADLEEAGAFLEDVPGMRGTRRFHPLFRAVLRDRLPLPAEEERSARLVAARWCARHGELPGAVGHAAAVGAWDAAARFVVDDLAVAEVIMDGPTGRLTGLLAGMPATPGTPEGVMVAAALALSHDDITRAERLLAGDAWLPGPDAALPSRLAACIVRQSVAYETGDAELLQAVTQTAMQLLPQVDHGRVAARPELSVFVLSGVATAHLRAGRLAQAADGYAAAVRAAVSERCGGLLAYCTQHLAFTEALLGRLRAAYDAAQRASDVVARTQELNRGPRHVADAALAWVAVERYDTAAAWHYLRTAEAGLEAGSGPRESVYAASLAIVRSRLLRARGELPAALSVLRGTPVAAPARRWVRHELDLAELRVLVAMGRHEEAFRGLALLGLDRPEVDVVRGAAFLAAGDPQHAVECAHRVLRQFGLPVGVLVDAWLLVAAATARQGDQERAAEALQTAVEFTVDDGGTRAVYESDAVLRRLLRLPGVAPADPGRPLVAGPVPVLSARQAEVLRHLAALTPAEEVAAMMHVSVGTVRTHIRDVLRKLQVTSRSEAVRRARELGLV
ncbi:AAA family ATPase [Dactylosporangium siamense]|uniref:Transcriptional regulator n=1 Tax=Dactylosporangium siamense TaxID=685454 RepID=A0A919PPK8_9ACTN|nr:AAA family ATPase [Dactylosporangium siamense]GIG48391.1 transcriptional regulator [Dactylosporangium siamense]